jgi:hypothetical protein
MHTSVLVMISPIRLPTPDIPHVPPGSGQTQFPPRRRANPSHTVTSPQSFPQFSDKLGTKTKECENRISPMMVFVCAECGINLTRPLARVALPVQAYHDCGHEFVGALMEPGTYATASQESRDWSFWAKITLFPGDIRNTRFIVEHCDGYCIGIDGWHGPNLACESCGSPVGARVDHCGHWQLTALLPEAVVGIDDGSPDPVIDWLDLLRHPEQLQLPPVEGHGWWNEIWLAAFGAALAQLLLVSGGARIQVPDGLLAQLLRRSLNRLLPAGQAVPQYDPPLTLALGGPQFEAPDANILLVPQHPQTGRLWPVSRPQLAVGLPLPVWAYLAFHHEHHQVPGSGTLTVEINRDEPLPPHPAGLFSPAPGPFVQTFKPLLEARNEPWLHAIYHRISNRCHYLEL